MGLGNRILKLKAEPKGAFRKFQVFNVNLRENDLSPFRPHWKALLMRSYVNIGGEVWYVHAIEAFAIHDSQPHIDISLIVTSKL